MELILLSILGWGAATAFLIDLFGDDDSDATPSAPGEDADTSATNGDDLLSGTPGGDTITGESGDDSIVGLGGDDYLYGNDGADSLLGQGGNDKLDGGDGNDNLIGGTGDDTAFGRLGDDFLRGGDGADALFGAQGDDVLMGDLGADTMEGGVGDDIIIGASFSDEAIASGDLRLSSDKDEGDVIDGGFGADTMILGNDDSATGGGGTDNFYVGDWINENQAAIINDYKDGEDIITLSYDASKSSGDVDITETPSGDAIISLDGQQLAIVRDAAGSLTQSDIVLRAQTPVDSSNNSSADYDASQLIRGTEGADSINGLGGNDTITGVEGNDSIWGGVGDDVLFGRSGDDVVTGAVGADRVFGTDGNDTVSGLWGNDWVRGGEGDDLVIDTQGSDSLFGDQGNDTIVGADLLDEKLYMRIASGKETGTLPSFDYSSDGDNSGDTLDGGAGSDVLYFGAGDYALGGSDADEFTVGDWIDRGQATIGDFDVSEDVVVYKAANGTTPNITVAYSAGATASSGDAIIQVDGQNAVMVSGVGTSFDISNVVVSTY